MARSVDLMGFLAEQALYWRNHDYPIQVQMLVFVGLVWVLAKVTSKVLKLLVLGVICFVLYLSIITHLPV